MIGWFGWVRLPDGWHRITGPDPTLALASRSLDTALARRGLRLPNLALCLTQGDRPRELSRTTT